MTLNFGKKRYPLQFILKMLPPQIIALFMILNKRIYRKIGKKDIFFLGKY